jgi:subtilisin family serine protease
MFKLKPTALAVALALAGTVQAQTVVPGTFETREISTVLKAGGVDKAWSRGITGKGAVIGVLDQGFDLTHSDFKNSIIASRNFVTGGAVTWGQHGTQMAGIAAGNLDGRGTVGVAPDAMLLLGQVGSGGTSATFSTAAVYRGLDWMSSQGAHVINMSFGMNYDPTFQKNVKTGSAKGVYFSPANYGVNYGSSAADMAAYAVATNRNVVLVAAAGNQGIAYSAFPGMYATRTDANGNLVLGGRMLIVGATDSTGSNIASFSNRAGHLCQNAAGTTCLDRYQTKDFFVVAPGMQVYGSAPTQLNLKDAYQNALAVNGTSPAAAYVSGGIALMKQAWPQLRAEQLVALTLNTARDMGARGVDEVYGYGMVDFDKATQPQGNLTVATRHQKLTGQAVAGQAVTATGVVTTSSIGSALKGSSVLGNTQVIDGIGRNYSVNLAQAMASNTAMTANYASPWLGLAPANYRQIATPVTKEMSMLMASTDSGMVSQINYQKGANIWQFQTGAMQERNGWLGNQGSGAMGLGSSATTWAMLGVEHSIAESTAVIAQYGVGFTRVQNSSESMIAVNGTLITDSWKLGVAQSNVFKQRDKAMLAVSAPVTVRRGSATVTGVTGYTYTEDADGNFTADPVVSSESVNLRPPVQEYNLVLGYTSPVGKNADVGVNLIRQFNAGGVSGASGYAFGLQAVARF